MPTNSTRTILCLGDIVGKSGRLAVEQCLHQLKEDHDVDFTIANIENSVAGFGFNKKIYNQFLDMHIDAFSTGNHVYAKRDVLDEFDSFDRLVRPLNFPSEHPGTGVRLFDCDGVSIALINIIGRVFMNLSDCPFKAMDAVLDRIKADIIIVDFHAETTSEKQAMGWYLNGRVNLMFGTHTHVQTNDSRLLSETTAYVTDVGMCGAYDSVIGMNAEVSIRKLVQQLPERHKPVDRPKTIVVGGIVIKVNVESNTVSEPIMIHQLIHNEVR